MTDTAASEPVDATVRRRFSEASAVTRLDETRFAAEIDAGWGIGGKPNGGYLTAILARAATEAASSVTDHPHPVAVSAHFCSSPDAGGAEIETQVLQSGRTITRVRSVLRQEGKLCVDVVATLGHLHPSARTTALATDEPNGDHGSRDASWAGGVPERDDRDAAEYLAFRPPRGTFPRGIPDLLDFRMSPESLRSLTGSPSGRGELRSRLALPDDEPFDPISLQFALDAMPPATLDIGPLTGWVPTLQFTTYVRALPAPGPIQLLHRAHLVADGLVDETCYAWDSTGAPVAHSTQLAVIARR
ncbi:thioesterase family protein [Planctomonas sp. JC2975]|uniref:thioesterase family protein n=1 Tax=Planctomonas sp. JC2975 TaxID=2729626 RepID=UPI001476272A|nr:thioesterase family protein [Planctomonas sp. JC2975]NNC12048.1 thioesterase family protein [Planctomonas sp. JC2975]